MKKLLHSQRNSDMGTNFTAALLAIMLVAIQLYCMGLYGTGSEDAAITSYKAPYTELDESQLSGATLTPDDGFVLSYDLSSSPALLYLDHALK